MWPVALEGKWPVDKVAKVEFNSLPRRTFFLTGCLWFDWSVGPIKLSDQSNAIVAGFLYMLLSICISMSHRRVPTLFPQWPSRPLWGLFFEKTNHFTMTTLNIRSAPMATWECAKQVQASPPNYQILIDVAYRAPNRTKILPINIDILLSFFKYLHTCFEYWYILLLINIAILL